MRTYFRFSQREKEGERERERERERESESIIIFSVLAARGRNPMDPEPKYIAEKRSRTAPSQV